MFHIISSVVHLLYIVRQLRKQFVGRYVPVIVNVDTLFDFLEFFLCELKTGLQFTDVTDCHSDKFVKSFVISFHASLHARLKGLELSVYYALKSDLLSGKCCCCSLVSRVVGRRVVLYRRGSLGSFLHCRLATVSSMTLRQYRQTIPFVECLTGRVTVSAR